MKKSKNRIAIEQAIVFGLPDSLAADERYDLAKIARYVAAALFDEDQIFQIVCAYVKERE